MNMQKFIIGLIVGIFFVTGVWYFMRAPQATPAPMQQQPTTSPTVTPPATTPGYGPKTPPYVVPPTSPPPAY